MQRWFEEFSQYPRPDRIRDKTLVLDGEWDFATETVDLGPFGRNASDIRWDRTINVPFCVESDLSGIGVDSPPAVMWYRRSFELTEDFVSGRRLLLNIGAADYESGVWLNGDFIGTHTGGYTPFRADVTDSARAGDNELVVRVTDTLDLRVPRGKQSFFSKPFGIFYTTVSGIWQSVWIESAGRAFLRNIRVDADAGTGLVDITADATGAAGEYRLEARIIDGGGDVCARSVEKFEIREGIPSPAALALKLDNPQLWRPRDPALYRLLLDITDTGGNVIDTLKTYFGFRTIEINDGKILLNSRPLYLKMLLNQGYYPRGHYTPENWDWFRRDVEQALAMGFNGVRMHQKIENPKFLFWCDALGLLMWEEMPSAYLWSRRMRKAIRRQWKDIIRRDRLHPSIVTWVPFNESWGVHNLVVSGRVRDFMVEIKNMTHELDPTRPVIDNSGFDHVETDILDIHHYLGSVERCREYYAELRNPENMEFEARNIVGRLDVANTPVKPLAPGSKYQGQPIVISEYGGFGFYKTDERPLLENFSDYTLAIAEDDLFQGYCYTQQYDTQQEQNGLLDFEREPKIPVEDIKAVNDRVDEIVGSRE